MENVYIQKEKSRDALNLSADAISRLIRMISAMPIPIVMCKLKFDLVAFVPVHHLRYSKMSALLHAWHFHHQEGLRTAAHPVRVQAIFLYNSSCAIRVANLANFSLDLATLELFFLKKRLATSWANLSESLWLRVSRWHYRTRARSCFYSVHTMF